MLTKRIALILLILCLVQPVFSHRPQNSRRDVVEQREFNIEQNPDRPAKIPDAILPLLKKDEQVRKCLQEETSNRNSIRAWFKASTVHLVRSRAADFVVQDSENAPLCLMGANIGPIWLFRNTGNKYELVLKAYTHNLKILRTRTRGYHDISIEAPTAVKILAAVYKFNGARYVPVKCWEQNIDDALKGHRGMHYYRCSDNVEKPY